MSDKIEIDYKNTKIRYEEFDNSWTIEVEGNTARQKGSLADAKKYVDSLRKKENTFKRFDVFSLSENTWSRKAFGNISTVTSIDDDGDIWVSINGKRSKVSLKYFHTEFSAITEKNKELVKSVIEKKNILKEVEKTIISIIESMDKVELPMKGAE